MESVGGSAKPGGSGFLAGNGKWYAIGAVVAVGVILYIRSQGSTSSTTDTTSTPATDSQNELNSLSDAVTALSASLGTNGINGSSGTESIPSNSNAGGTQPSTTITGFAASAYPALLGRNIENQSVANQWSGSGNITQQFLGISGSTEGLEHATSETSATYIQNQYSALGLGTADSGGLTFWQGQLTQDIKSTGNTNAGYIKEQQQFANSAAQNPSSANYQQPVK